MKSKSVFDEIGVKPFRENGDMKPLTEVFQELGEKLAETAKKNSSISYAVAIAKQEYEKEEMDAIKIIMERYGCSYSNAVTIYRIAELNKIEPCDPENLLHLAKQMEKASKSCHPAFKPHRNRGG